MQRTRILTTALALSLGLGSGLAQARGGHGGGHGGHWGHWGLGLAIGLPLIYGLSRSTVVVQQAPPVVYTEPAPVAPAAPAMPPAPPEPIVYPSGGQLASRSRLSPRLRAHGPAQPFAESRGQPARAGQVLAQRPDDVPELAAEARTGVAAAQVLLESRALRCGEVAVQVVGEQVQHLAAG